MHKIKIAQIGIGHDHAPCIFRSLKNQKDIFDIKGYYLPENEKIKYKNMLTVFEDYKELTLDEILNDDDIEAVTIETEEKNLTKYSILAAKAGKHIHMDKPGGTELADFEKLIDIVKAKKEIFHLGYMYRFNPEVQKLMQAIKDGELGEIFAVEAQMSCIFPTTSEKRQWLENFDGGMMFFLGCHLVDIIISIKGIPKKIIPFNTCTGINGVTAEDYGMALFEYADGISFAKTCAAEISGGARRQIVVCGSKKTVEIKPIEIYADDGMYTVVSNYKNKVWEPDTVTKTGPFDRYDNMMKDFAQCVSGEHANQYSYDYELSVYKCLLSACGK